MLIEGIFAAVSTPFYPDEQVYFRKLEANIVRYSRSLLSGMVVLGSTGEAPALNDLETNDVLRVAAESAAPEKVLIAGVGRESAKATLELTEAAAKFKYDAVLVRTPTYYASQMIPAANTKQTAILANMLSVASVTLWLSTRPESIVSAVSCGVPVAIMASRVD